MKYLNILGDFVKKAKILANSLSGKSEEGLHSGGWVGVVEGVIVENVSDLYL